MEKGEYWTPTPEQAKRSKQMKQNMADRVRTEHANYIVGLVAEMRRCLRESEKARDRFYEVRDALKRERGKSGAQLDHEMSIDINAKMAVSNSQLFDRWATKYAAIVQAEISCFENDLHPTEYPK
jgi:hypothetical protein